MRVILLRHGRTKGNAERRYIGRTDEPLSEAGRADAQRAGVCMQVARVFVSPLLRARETARICLPNAEQIVCTDLREMDFGAFEGRTAQELANDEAYNAWVAADCLPPCPGGEDILSFQARVCKAFCAALENSAAMGADALWVVAHGGSIMAIMERYALPRRPYYEWMVDNVCGYAANAKTGTDGGLTLSDCVYFTDLGGLL